MHRGAYVARVGEHKAMRFKTQNQRRSAATRGRDESSRAAARAQPRLDTQRRATALRAQRPPRGGSRDAPPVAVVCEDAFLYRESRFSSGRRNSASSKAC